MSSILSKTRRSRCSSVSFMQSGSTPALRDRSQPSTTFLNFGSQTPRVPSRNSFFSSLSCSF